MKHKIVTSLTPELVTSSSNRINELFINSDLLWSESYSHDGGGNALYLDKNNSCKNEPICLTTKDYNVCSKVHEYGGNAFTLGDRHIFFVNKSDQKIYTFDITSFIPCSLTPDGNYRFTSLEYNSKLKTLFAVCENHCKDTTNPSNYIVSLNVSESSNSCTPLFEDADFFSDVNVSYDGSLITWNQWYHPYMPWDQSQIGLAKVTIKGKETILSNINIISYQNISYMQPRIVKFGEKADHSGIYFLFYLNDSTGYYNLYMREIIITGDIKQGGLLLGEEVGPLVKNNDNPILKDIGLPLWNTGDSAYDVSPNDPSKLVVVAENDMYVLVNSSLNATYFDTEIMNKSKYNGGYHCYQVLRGDDLNIALLTHLRVAFGEGGKSNTLNCFAITARKFEVESISRFDINLVTTPQLAAPTIHSEVVHKTCDLPIDPEILSVPEEITFPINSRNKENIVEGHALFYAPKHKDIRKLHGNLAPLIVISHGGPTAKKYPMLNLKDTQYYTSKGYAVLYVNYRGSSGYGRAYRDALYGNWGVYDVEDCCCAALHVSKTLKKCHPDLIFITGSSSGGFTTLACLTFQPDVFKAGISYYGVSDLKSLVADTHKFEKYYTQRLILGNQFSLEDKKSMGDVMDDNLGLTPDQIRIFDERSPINFIDRIKSPIAFFHGADDKVVPPNQAIEMYEKLKLKGITTEMTLFEGEGHGFCDAKNIKVCLEKGIAFLDKIVASYEHEKCI